MDCMNERYKLSQKEKFKLNEEELQLYEETMDIIERIQYGGGKLRVNFNIFRVN